MSKIEKFITPIDASKRIYTLRNQEIMLDHDLADMFGVELKVLKQAVKRNMERFPDDFMWTVTENELDLLRSQAVLADSERFSEQEFGSQSVTEISKNLSGEAAKPNIRSQIVTEIESVSHAFSDFDESESPIMIEIVENLPSVDLNQKFGSQFVTEISKNSSGVAVKPNIRSQTVTEIANDSQVFSESPAGGFSGRRGSRYAPFAFNEQGVALLSSVLNSPRAIQVHISIIRLFVQLRRQQRSDTHIVPKLLSMQNMLSQRFDQLEARFQKTAPAIVPPAKHESVSIIQNTVARHFGVTASDLKSAARMQPISLARHIAIFLVKKHLGMGFSEIGRCFGGRDHSTVLHSYRKTHVDSEDNEVVRKAVLSLQNELQSILC